MQDHDEYIYDGLWLERTYSGAPDECSECFRNGTIVKKDECKEHNKP